MNINEYKSVTVFVMASNETKVLRETINRINLSCDKSDIDKIVIVLKSHSCPSFYEAEEMITLPEYGNVEMYVQKSPNAVLCIAELPPLAYGSHFIIMSADMEMNPDDVGTLIKKSKENPQKIICAAKWLKESTVIGYGVFHEIGSRLMNTFISVLFRKKIKDPFSMFQIYPVEVYEKMHFTCSERFMYEYTLKPLKYGVEYEEIPTVYVKRKEGKSNFNFLVLLKVAITFCFTAIRLTLTSRGIQDESKSEREDISNSGK